MFECTGGIYYRSVSLQTDVIHADIIRGGPWDQADVKGEDWNIPLADGEEIRARQLWRREIELAIDVYSITSDDWHDTLMGLAAIFDFSLSPGTLELRPGDGATPYLGIPEGTVYTIEARAKSLMPGPVQAHMRYQRRSYILKAAVPEWTVGSSGS